MELRATAPSLTASYSKFGRDFWSRRDATRASRQAPGEGDNEVAAHCGDGVWDVALGPNLRRRGVDNFGEAQTARRPRRKTVLRGESSPFRRSRNRMRRCRA